MLVKGGAADSVDGLAVRFGRLLLLGILFTHAQREGIGYGPLSKGKEVVVLRKHARRQ